VANGDGTTRRYSGLLFGCYAGEHLKPPGFLGESFSLLPWDHVVGRRFLVDSGNL
jgi:hypothetical protein